MRRLGADAPASWRHIAPANIGSGDPRCGSDCLEIKDGENRVGLTPGAVTALVRRGHEVLVETSAGEGSFLSDEEYAEAGATIVPTAAEAWAAEMIVKVKEPVGPEYDFLRATRFSSPISTWPPTGN